MKIIHLTDIHLKSNYSENWIFERIDAMYRACGSILIENDKVIILIGGDIAYSGKQEEYKLADIFIGNLKKYIEDHYSADVTILLVPGNHDCNFDEKNSIREMLYKAISPENDLDQSVFDIFTSCQKNFFEFSKQYCELDSKKLCTTEEWGCSEKKALFLLFNSAWMSSKQENPGHLILPQNMYPTIQSNEYDCVIAVMHHPYNWLNPDNAICFREFMRQHVDILIMNHEHRKDVVKSFGKKWSIIEYKGKSLQGDNSDKDCAFSVYAFDDSWQNIHTYDFVWDKTKGLFTRNDSKDMFQRNSNLAYTILNPSIEFMKKINDPSIIINHFNVENILLPDIYCWPVLEILNFDDQESGFKYSRKITEKLEYELLESEISIIIGESLTGKTALAKMLFYQYCCHTDYCCILCNGEHLKTQVYGNLQDIIEDIFIQEYSEDKLEYFRQLLPEKKYPLNNQCTQRA